MDLNRNGVLYDVSTFCATAFLFLMPISARRLYRCNVHTTAGWRGAFKAALAALLSILLATYWINGIPTNVEPKNQVLASLVTSSLASLGLSWLILLKHQRSADTPIQVTLYLAVAVLCDVALLCFRAGSTTHIALLRIILCRLCVHVTILTADSYTPSSRRIVYEGRFADVLHRFLDSIFLIWIIQYLRQGYITLLAHRDLPELSSTLKSGSTRTAMLEAWAKRSRPEAKNSLQIALMQCVKRPFYSALLPRLSLLLFRYCQPVLIRVAIGFVINAPAKPQYRHGMALLLSAVGVYIGLIISTSVYQHQINQLRLITKSALIGLIHEKVIRSPSMSSNIADAPTLITTDVDGLARIGEMLHETWAQIVEVFVGVGLLATQVGWVSPLPLILIYFCSRVSRFVAKRLRLYQTSWNVATQNRITATTSIISAMKAVKMLGFQEQQLRRLQQYRVEELDSASKLRWVMVYYNASANALGIFSPVITLIIYAALTGFRGTLFDTQTAFTTMAILSMVTHPANMVMTIVPRTVAAFAGFDRIQDFLLRPAFHDHRTTHSANGMITPSEHVSRDGLDGLRGCAFKVDKLVVGRERRILDGVSLEVPAGSFAILSGPTGSGKTTLFRALLGEVAPIKGCVSISTKLIGYCSQQPWLPSGTVKEVIFGPESNSRLSEDDLEIWYRTVVQACCLVHDFASLSHGDQTHISSCGFNLSGGQRQRVALARAIFARNAILLLDDTFSALDSDTERRVFENLLGPRGLLRQSNITVFLVSNSYQFLRFADTIMVLQDQIITYKGHWQSLGSKAEFVVKFDLKQPHAADNMILSTGFNKLSSQVRAQESYRSDLERRAGDVALYNYYLRSIDPRTLAYFLIATGLYAFFITFSQLWLQLWIRSSSDKKWLYSAGFFLISLVSWSSTSAQMWSILIRLAPQSGMRLHQRLLDNVMGAPLTYFSQNDNGEILNRFSQDIQVIDKQLPEALQVFVTQIFKLFMQLALLCFTERWLLASLPFCLVVIYIVQKVYLRTLRQLRLLELESRAAIFSNFLESIEGLETIRSFRWCTTFIHENVRSIDKSQQAEFLLLCLQRWLNVVLDLMTAAIRIGVVAGAVFIRGRVSGAQLGIALNVMLVINSTLLKLVESWTTLEASLGAIARLRKLETTILKEDAETWTVEPPGDWPSQGHLELRSVTASYGSDSVALQDVVLNVTAGQRLVVCGRTGSGKSTLLLSLLRLLDLRSGKILLDGIDIQQVRLGLLRHRAFITISQDVFILNHESLRYNLDPLGVSSDRDIVAFLDQTGLWSHFSTGHATTPRASESSILDQAISHLPVLSIGQCQLFAISRALLKSRSLHESGCKPIILLDEVTSALDLTTESTIHRIIDEFFISEGHTVIIVSHRLIRPSTKKEGIGRIAVFREGQLQEFMNDFQPEEIYRVEKM